MERKLLDALGMVKPAVVGNWKSLTVRGIAGIAFGFGALSWPAMSLAALATAFGVYSLIDGVAVTILAGTVDEREYAWAFLLEGLIGLGVAMLVFGWTGMALEVIATAIGFWGVVTGLLELTVAFRLRHEPPGQAPLGLAGVVSASLGVALLVRPQAGVGGLVALLGAYAFVFGAAMLLQALRWRRALRVLRASHAGTYVARRHLAAEGPAVQENEHDSTNED